MEDTQLMKGILEGCVLSVIARGETYGYEILSLLEQEGFADLGEGTLYPVLTRLDKNHYIACRRAKSPLGPIRKYYTITPLGLERLQSFKEQFRSVTASANRVLFHYLTQDDRDFSHEMNASNLLTMEDTERKEREERC